MKAFLKFLLAVAVFAFAFWLAYAFYYFLFPQSKGIFNQSGPPGSISEYIGDEGEGESLELPCESMICLTHVRVAPDGIAVLSGTAKPDWRLAVVAEEGAVVAQATANGKGEWGAVPDTPLAAGDHLLAIFAVDKAGGEHIADRAVLVTIADNRRDAPLVVLVPYTDEATGLAQVLQSPFAGGAVAEVADLFAVPSEGGGPLITIRRITPQALTEAGDRPILIEGVVLGEGEITASLASPDIAYVTDYEVTEEVARRSRITGVRGADDRYRATALLFNFLPEEARYEARVVLRDGDGDSDGDGLGQVQAEASVFLTGDKLDVAGVGGALLVVQKGDALWRIAYKAYGQGIRFVDIYQANIDDIGHPDLIFPDQVFVLPKQ